MGIPTIHQDPTSKAMYCTTGLRSMRGADILLDKPAPLRRYRWYVDEVFQPALITSNNYTPTFLEAGSTVRCEVDIGGSVVSSEPVIITDWFKQMPNDSLILLDAEKASIDVMFPEGPGLYASSLWTNEGSGPDAVQTTGANKPSLAVGGELSGDWAGLAYMHFDGIDNIMSFPGLASAANDWTVYTIARLDSSAPTAHPIFDSGTGRLIFGWLKTGAAERPAYYDGATWRSFATTNEEVFPRYEASTLVVKNNSEAYVGRTLLAGTFAYTPQAIGGTCALGGYYTGSGPWFDGGLYYFAIYPGAHTVQQREQAWDYLESRFPVVF